MRIIICLLLLCTVAGCQNADRTLPILGNKIEVNGKEQHPAIADFDFVDQKGQPFTGKTYSGKIYVADFIFLSCPTICPKMTTEMKKVYDSYITNPAVCFVSHTIDPEHDTISRLNNYAQGLGVDPAKWKFVTGDKDKIYKIAEKSYYSIAKKDTTAPGGFVHSGGLLLVDAARHIRGVYDSSKPEETQRLIADIAILLKEHNSNKNQ